jgi:DNA repair exonuclease SbcCD ATPase subunit
LIKTASDKLELEVTVHDSKGERLISSLSGWQKVVLKLVWILAIVSYTRWTSLFLDETINNLDTDTVSRVATMLEDFVRQRDVKLYVVTHSPQIQQMNIWDSVITL